MTEPSLIFDFSNTMYRSYYVVPEWKRAGPPPGGVFMLYMMVKKACAKYPYPVIFALDGGRSSRQELDENYKAQRVPTPDHEEFKRQWDIGLDMLRAAGAPLWRIEGYEADDLIATYSRQNDCFIVSADKDFDSLVRDGVSIVRASKDNSDFEDFTSDKFIEKYGFNQDCYTVYKSFVGDSSDNIKGITGWGPKKTTEAIKKFGNDTARMWRSGSGKQYDILRAEWGVFEKNMKIFEFKTDITSILEPSRLDWPSATEFMKDLGFAF